MAIFNSYVDITRGSDQRVYPIHIPLNHYKIPLNHHKIPLKPRQSALFLSAAVPPRRDAARRRRGAGEDPAPRHAAGGGKPAQASHAAGEADEDGDAGGTWKVFTIW